jgi:hypothetical protein
VRLGRRYASATRQCLGKWADNETPDRQPIRFVRSPGRQAFQSQVVRARHSLLLAPYQGRNLEVIVYVTASSRRAGCHGTHRNTRCATLLAASSQEKILPPLGSGNGGCETGATGASDQHIALTRQSLSYPPKEVSVFAYRSKRPRDDQTLISCWYQTSSDTIEYVATKARIKTPARVPSVHRPPNRLVPPRRRRRSSPAPVLANVGVTDDHAANHEDPGQRCQEAEITKTATLSDPPSARYCHLTLPPTA